MKIEIIGTGPGSRDLILPLALNTAAECDVLIGGKRNLAAFSLPEKEQIPLTGDLQAVIDYIKTNRETKKIGVLASGDPCFYGITGFLRKHFSKDELSVTPGLSCFQYLACKAGLCWENAAFCSLHGREEEILPVIQNHKLTFILTDQSWTPRKIAAYLCENNLARVKMIVGSNLSYDTEEIITGKAEEISALTGNFTLAVTAVCNEEN